MLQKEDLKKFQVVYYKNDLIVIVSDEIQIPFFRDGIASLLCLKPMDFSNPNEWESFNGYLTYSIENDSYDVVMTENLINVGFVLNEANDAYILHDKATSKLRSILGLIALSDKLDGKEGSLSFLTKLYEQQKSNL